MLSTIKYWLMAKIVNRLIVTAKFSPINLIRLFIMGTSIMLHTPTYIEEILGISQGVICQQNNDWRAKFREKSLYRSKKSTKCTHLVGWRDFFWEGGTLRVLLRSGVPFVRFWPMFGALTLSVAAKITTLLYTKTLIHKQSNNELHWSSNSQTE